jgi:hypothetical protein
MYYGIQFTQNNFENKFRPPNPAISLAWKRKKENFQAYYKQPYSAESENNDHFLPFPLVL